MLNNMSTSIALTDVEQKEHIEGMIKRIVVGFFGLMLAYANQLCLCDIMLLSAWIALLWISSS